MKDETPIELLEAQRRIRAAQTRIHVNEPASLDHALEKLRTTIESKPHVPNVEFDAREQALTIDKLRAAWNAPKRHEARTEFAPVQEWHACLSKLLARLGTGFTVALVGKRGPGKTQIGMELMRHATYRQRSAYYCTAMDYFMRVKDAFHSDRKETQADAQKFFVRPKMLVIDEMNVRSDSKWEDNMLADLVGKRYNAMLDTVLISNETADAFEKSMGPSIIDRLNETGGIVECTWRSFRE